MLKKMTRELEQQLLVSMVNIWQISFKEGDNTDAMDFMSWSK